MSTSSTHVCLTTRYGTLGGHSPYLLPTLQTMLLKPKPLTLKGVYASLRAIALTKGQGSAQRKQDTIKQLISRCRWAQPSGLSLHHIAPQVMDAAVSYCGNTLLADVVCQLIPSVTSACQRESCMLSVSCLVNVVMSSMHGVIR